MNGELIEFRDTINQAIAHGQFDLPVVGEDGIPMVVVALEDEPLFDLLGRLRAVGGNVNLFVRGQGRVRRVSVADQISADTIPDDMTGQEGPGPMASVGLFLDYLERRPNGVVLSVVNPASPAVARDVVEFA